MNLKIVNEASLQQQLDAVRHGTPEEQKEFLQSIDDVLENDHSHFLIMLILLEIVLNIPVEVVFFKIITSLF